jgi:hypothetical protein
MKHTLGVSEKKNKLKCEKQQTRIRKGEVKRADFKGAKLRQKEESRRTNERSENK